MRCAGLAEPEADTHLVHGAFLSFSVLNVPKAASAYFLCSWYEEAAKYRRGEITKDEYDEWRYFYPRYDKGGPFHHLPTFLDEEYGKSKKRKRK